MTHAAPTTAWMEAQQVFPFKPQPITLVAYQVDCADILDLTQKKNLTQLNIVFADLACAWEDRATQGLQPSSWLLTDKLQTMGIVGESCKALHPVVNKKTVI